MAQSRRVLFVASALPPFTEESSTASLARSLPGELQEDGDFSIRVMMPCYGNIDERKHNLHEVIRLSGTEVEMGPDTESVTVKVASAPELKLQVYFMDHDEYFGRDGQAKDQDGNVFDDNVDRALFFNRSVLETMRKLRWGPDLIHSFGWIGGFTPFLLATDYGEDELLSSAQSVFTPHVESLSTQVDSTFADGMDLALDGSVGSTLTDVGVDYADAIIFPPDRAPTDGASQFDEQSTGRSKQLATLYNQMLGEVPA